MALKSAYEYVRNNIDNSFDIYVEGMDFTYDNYLITTLKKALAVLELQDEMFDNITNW